jgi:hypothetical protein
MKSDDCRAFRSEFDTGDEAKVIAMNLAGEGKIFVVRL